MVLKTTESLHDTALTTTLSELRLRHSNEVRVLMVTVLRASGRGFIQSLLSVGCGEDDQVLCNGKIKLCRRDNNYNHVSNIKMTFYTFILQNLSACLQLTSFNSSCHLNSPVGSGGLVIAQRPVHNDPRALGHKFLYIPSERGRPNCDSMPGGDTPL